MFSILSSSPARISSPRETESNQDALFLSLPGALKDEKVGTERQELEQQQQQQQQQQEKKRPSPDIDVGVAEVPVRVRLARHAVVAPGAHNGLDSSVDEVVEGLDVLADEASDLLKIVGSSGGGQRGFEVEKKSSRRKKKLNA